jgi:catechol-2,3-dioxygenase
VGPGREGFGDEGGRHVHFALSARPGALDALAKHLQEAGLRPKGPVEHDGGDRSLYVEDPEGNAVETWDFFERGEGEREGVDALS